MRTRTPRRRRAALPALSAATAASLVAGAAVVLAAGPATAAQVVEPLVCGDTVLTIRHGTDHSSEHGGWGVAQLVDASGHPVGHLVPLSFTFSAYDVTQSRTLFTDSVSKGGGHASSRGATTCSQTTTATLADFLEPGETPPPGAALTDTVRVTFTVTLVQRTYG